MKFTYRISCCCVEWLWRYVENGWKKHHFIFWCVFYPISLISFYERVQSSLRNSRTKFRAAVLRRCWDTLKMGGNTTTSFPGALFIGFLWFFFYKHVLVSLRNSRSIFCAAGASVEEICWNGQKWESLRDCFAYMGAFFLIFLHFFFKCILFSLRNAHTNFYKAVLSHCGSMLKLVRNSTNLLYGTFFMNVFYLAYETHIQIYVRLCWVVSIRI